MSSPLLGTEVDLALSTSTNRSHIQFRTLLTLLPLLKSNQYYVFFLRNHQPAKHGTSNVNAAARVIWRTLIETWKGDESLAKRVDLSLPTILTNASLQAILGKHLEVQDLIQAVSYSKQHTTTKVTGRIKFTFAQSLVLCVSAHEQCAMTHNHFLAYADTLRSRVHLMIAALVEDITGIYRKILTITRRDLHCLPPCC